MVRNLPVTDLSSSSSIRCIILVHSVIRVLCALDITDRVLSGEGNAIGRVRPFSLQLLNQLTFDLDIFIVIIYLPNSTTLLAHR